MNTGYLATGINRTIKLVHVIVLSVFKPNPAPHFFDRVDHINREVTDNRLVNLRWSNRTLNGFNRTVRKGYYKTRSGFCASIQFKGHKLLLGTFPTPELARARYLEARKDAMDIYDPYTVY
jgi:hypothetical protein